MISKHHATYSENGRLPGGLLIVAVFMVPLVFLPRLFLDPFNVPKLALLSLICGLVMIWLPFEKTFPTPSSVRVPALLFAVPAVLSWVFSPFHGETLIGQYQTFLGLLPGLLPVVFALLLAPRLEGRVPLVTGALVLAGAVASIYGFVQAMGLDPLRLYYEGLTSVAPTTTLGNTNFAGSFLAIVLPLTLFFWNRPGKARYWALASTCITALTLILTLSQGAWAAAVGGVSIVLLLGSGFPRKLARLASIAVVGGISAVIVASIALVPLGIELPTGGGGAKERAMFWEGAVAMSVDRPLTGWGPDAYALKIGAYRAPGSFLEYPGRSPEDPHSVPLATLANNGLIGLLGLLGISVWAVGRIGSSRQSDRLVASIAGGLTAYAIQALVSIDHPPLRFTLWVLLAALAAATVQEGAEARSLRQRPVLRVARFSYAVVGLFFVSAGLVLALSDIKARSAVTLRAQQESEGSRLLLREALELREEFTYRQLLASGVAATLITENEDSVLEPMRQAFGPWGDSPHPEVGLIYGRLLHYVAPDEPRVVEEAIRWLQRARILDPHNPVVQIELADALTTMGDAQTAQALLEELEEELPAVGDVYPEYWSAMSAARLASNDLVGAQEAAGTAKRLHKDQCAATAAGELIRAHTTEVPPTSSELLTLNIQCDAEYYNLFLYRLPAGARSDYV